MTELTAQGIFDDSVRRLAGMKCMAAKWLSPNSSPRCMYRSPTGPCLVGVYLSDEEVAPDGGVTYLECNTEVQVPTLDDIPNSGILHLMDYYLVPDRLCQHVKLLSALQDTHDNMQLWADAGHGPPIPDEMGSELEAVATEFSVSNGVIREVWPHLYP